MSKILKCENCGTYSLKDKCCGKKTISSQPAKYSPLDKYAEYRRRAKNEDQ
jgi:H/ACA ribonucleoprotein complex subunit 3